MGKRKPRVRFICCICGKSFTENQSQANKRLNRNSGNTDQCCSTPCLVEYRKRKVYHA